MSEEENCSVAIRSHTIRMRIIKQDELPHKMNEELQYEYVIMHKKA